VRFRLRTRALLGLAAAIAVAGLAYALVASATTPSAGPPDVRVDELGRLQAFDVYYRDLISGHSALVRRLGIRYRAWDGAVRTAYVVLPRWYSRANDPVLPLVISPHGRGIKARDNLHFWGGLPAFGPFFVVSPEGQGRVLARYSWGWKGQIDDLARMPAVLARELPWVHFDPRRIYAVGSSMGGQETLLLVARFPHLLAGAAALDSDTDLAARYYAMRSLAGGGRFLQDLVRAEVGGTPAQVPGAYRARSPIDWARAIARSGVPLHIWWSTNDRVVVDQNDESGRLYRLIKAFRPRAPVTEYVGAWVHSKEFQASRRLPLALVELGLIRLRERIPRPDRVDRTLPAPRVVANWSPSR
jgi:hypothetical protein